MTPTKSSVYMYKYLSTVYKEYQVSWDLVYKVKIHALLNISNHHLFLLKKKGSIKNKIISHYCHLC